ncbi:hypothetical protein MUO74_07200 [Candidatus Bathyarchaeota archaeon]|nr:hypothetical protein [Candidatus Bathyarchaeota archaeon]
MKTDRMTTALLLAFVLVSILSIAIPTRSQSETNYSPWKDINEDGVIDIYDVVHLASSYGSAGDHTQPVQTYKAVEEITILDASRTIDGVEHGMFTFSDNCAFGFSPKEGFVGVTKIIGNLYGYCEGSGFHRYSVQINGMSWMQGSRIDQIDSYVMHSLFGCEETSVLSEVKPGINMLTIDFMGDHVNIIKVVLLVEYEYQA